MVTGGSNKLKMERPVDLTDEVIRLQIGNRTDPAAKSLDRSRSEQIGLDRSRSARMVAARAWIGADRLGSEQIGEGGGGAILFRQCRGDRSSWFGLGGFGFVGFWFRVGWVLV